MTSGALFWVESTAPVPVASAAMFVLKVLASCGFDPVIPTIFALALLYSLITDV